MTTLSGLAKYPLPHHRRLRAFAFDPGISRQIETSGINEVTIKIPWDSELNVGPVDSYLEVVDYDPASQAFYEPVDLGDCFLLAQDGLAPAEGNPQFHQQMVYAVARTTIGHFESALGRRILWAVRRTKENETIRDENVEHLRIYPHALREANAYYSPAKKALLFGYFPAPSQECGCNMPGETVFTCLSHDIVAHETTHAIIDGLHPRFIEPSNIDVLALHEALADVIALFQHFTYPDVLKHQISMTRGDLEKQNLLGELAYQFGQAMGRHGALRSAIGEPDPVTKKWVPKEPDPTKIQTATEPHERGAVFVAAVFDAFLSIYKARIQDLLRIASGGRGILPEGEISPDLVNRLADEAAKTANHILQMCIRALDYCPPTDPDFGDYLRALITADIELVPDDQHNYRLAVIEAFRRWGIYPRDVRSLSGESLLWHAPDEEEQKSYRSVFGGPDGLRKIVPNWDTKTPRKQIPEEARRSRIQFHEKFVAPKARKAVRAAHIILDNPLPSLYQKNGTASVEIHSVRPARRIGPDGHTILELVIEITQRRRGYLDPDIQDRVDKGTLAPPAPDFILRGGCTLLVNPTDGNVRYCIYKNIMSENRLKRMRQYLQEGTAPSLQATYFGNPLMEYFQGSAEKAGFEPFAMVHRSTDVTEEE